MSFSSLLWFAPLHSILLPLESISVLSRSSTSIFTYTSFSLHLYIYKSLVSFKIGQCFLTQNKVLKFNFFHPYCFVLIFGGVVFGFVFTQEDKQGFSYYSTGSVTLLLGNVFYHAGFFPTTTSVWRDLKEVSSVQSLSCIRLFVTAWTARPPCPSLTPRVYSNSCPLSWWMLSNHPILCRPLLLLPSIFPRSGSFQMSQLFTSGGQRIGVSASTSVLLMNTQDWSPLEWTSWISLQSKGLSRVLSNTIKDKKKHNCHFVPWSQSRLPQVYNGDQARLWELLEQGFCRNLPQLLFQLDWTKARYSNSQAT